MFALRKMIAVALFFLPSLADASQEGEVEWAKLSFCNSTGYCVDIAQSQAHELSSLAVSHSGRSIEIPVSMREGVGRPLLNDVRLVSSQRADGGYENRLEIPFVSLTASGSSKKSVLKIYIYEDSAYKSETELTAEGSD
ncbi:hypothetical protein N789_03095 [Arenimonas oryziterrae DSM 21050 = YC6267]|uniref:Uncharacterized protein n=2 Tax=Arenimonas TaxID=490567 RepID=A0A091B0E8_9GAMM|nr:hypothetical protein N789_03095 [Arenimonas oryziterrae DSM 21050 = YC6267]